MQYKFICIQDKHDIYTSVSEEERFIFPNRKKITCTFVNSLAFNKKKRRVALSGF